MKRLIILLAVFGLTCPVLAANVVTLSVTDAGSGQVLVTYDSTGSDELPVAMAIKISITNGVTVDSTADILETNADYNTNIDYIVDMAEPNTYDPQAPVGDPLADPDNAGRATLPASTFSVCMGRLTEPPSGAAVCGTVIEFQVPAPPIPWSLTADDWPVTVTAEADTLRGGVVGTAGGVFIVVPGSASVGSPPWPPPCPCHPCGDANCDDLISPADAVILVNHWSPKPYDKCADFNNDGIISPADAVILVNHWSPKPNCPASDGCQ